MKNKKSKASGIPTCRMKKLKNSCKLDDQIGMEQIRSTTLKESLDKKRQIKLDDVNECSKKLHLEEKTRFECSTCNKIFHSYQALGGHRASHKRAKGCESSVDQTNEHNPCPNQTENNNNLELLATIKVEAFKKHIKDEHECPICFKIFPSRQALEGHKRSHVIVVAKSNQPIIEM